MNVTEAKKMFALLGKATHRTGLPILGAALAQNGYIQTTNLSIGVRLPWSGEDMLVFPRQVLDLLKGQERDAEVTITRKHIEVGPLKVQNDAAGFELNEFPRMDYDLPFAGALSCDQVASLKLAAGFTGYDAGQPILEYVHLFSEGIIATDRSAVYWDKFAYEGKEVDIPAKVISLLPGAGVVVAKGPSNGSVFCRLMDATHGVDILFRVPEYPYPEVWRLIPDDYLLTTKIEAPAVRSIVEPFAKRGMEAPVNVRLNGTLSITPHQAEPVEMAVSVQRGENAPDDMTIKFNPALLARGLSPFGGEVTWELRSPEELIRLREGSLSTVVLPMMPY